MRSSRFLHWLFAALMASTPAFCQEKLPSATALSSETAPADCSKLEAGGFNCLNRVSGFSIIVPDGWALQTSSGKQNEDMKLINEDEGLLLIAGVITGDSKPKNLDEFLKKFADLQPDDMKDVTWSTPEKLTIGEVEGRAVIMEGRTNSLRTRMYIAILQKSEQFYMMLLAGPRSAALRAEPAWKDIYTSFKVLTPPALAAPEVKPEPPGHSSTLKDDQTRTTLTLPQGWLPAPGLHEEAVLQGKNSTLNAYVIVIVERRQDFEKGFLIDQYGQLVTGRMQNKLKDAEVSSPERLNINGQVALQYEVSGVSSPHKIRYLVTVVASDDHFVQILGWSTPSDFERKLRDLKAIAMTFRIKD